MEFHLLLYVQESTYSQEYETPNPDQTAERSEDGEHQHCQLQAALCACCNAAVLQRLQVQTVTFSSIILQRRQCLREQLTLRCSI